MGSGFRIASSMLAATVATVGLAACGGSSASSAPKVSSAAAITRCENNKSTAAVVTRATGSASKVPAFCRCLQSRLVADGFGDRPTNSGSTEVRRATSVALFSCAGRIGSGA